MNTDKTVRYHRLKRRAAIASTAGAAAVLLALVATGASAQLRAAVASLLGARADPSAPAVIAAFVTLLAVILYSASLPLAWYSGFMLERRYALLDESAARWLLDSSKGFALGLLLGTAGAELMYLAIRHVPRFWWVAAGVVFGAGLLLLARAAPVLLLPLFYRFAPLDRPELAARLRELTDRAGLPAIDVRVWGLGEKSRRANAALVGVGRTRRILLSDTLLAGYTDDEIEVVLAHELAHHAHRDVLAAVAAQSAVLTAGLAAGAGLLALALRSRLAPGILGPGDVAGLPLILLGVGAVSTALTPLVNALSRRHEHRADAFALRLTLRPAAFISAMRRLGAQNLAEPHPSRLALWLFHSHPSLEERVARARAFEMSAASERPAARASAGSDRPA
ncbi:MAG TPA: M48 family metalloprotease [Vicinamibacterales bacterium]|nr:M48 family metalloprotease [Vicinamibacterales bacterium]